jgi:hypothetical protein
MILAQMRELAVGILEQSGKSDGTGSTSGFYQMFLVHGILGSKDLAAEPTLAGLYSALDEAASATDCDAQKRYVAIGQAILSILGFTDDFVHPELSSKNEKELSGKHKKESSKTTETDEGKTYWDDVFAKRTSIADLRNIDLLPGYGSKGCKARAQALVKAAVCAESGSCD